MNKKELVAKIAEISKLSKVESEFALKVVTDAIVEGLVEEGKVKIVGLGTFEKIERPERTCRNPQDGSTILVPAKNAVRFKASTTLKADVNE